MIADQLREFKHKVPFKPFTIHMNSGQKFVVDDPESWCRPEAGRQMPLSRCRAGRFRLSI